MGSREDNFVDEHAVVLEEAKDDLGEGSNEEMEE